MENKDCLFEPSTPDNSCREVLKLYQAADESTRMDMYMTYRELRARFEEIEGGTLAPVGGSVGRRLSIEWLRLVF